MLMLVFDMGYPLEIVLNTDDPLITLLLVCVPVTVVCQMLWLLLRFVPWLMAKCRIWKNDHHSNDGDHAEQDDEEATEWGDLDVVDDAEQGSFAFDSLRYRYPSAGVVEVEYVIRNRSHTTAFCRNRFVAVYQRGVGLQQLDTPREFALLRGACVRMTQTFERRGEDDELFEWFPTGPRSDPWLLTCTGE